MGRSNHGYPPMILLHHNLSPVLELLHHGGEVVRHLGVGHAYLFHTFNDTSSFASSFGVRAGHWQGGSHPLLLAPLLERSLGQPRQRGDQLRFRMKLKHVLPCIRFFNAGETLLASAGHMYSGIR